MDYKAEVWKDVKGYEGYYQVSDEGRVRSSDRYLRIRGGGKQLKKGRILRPVFNKRNGYFSVGLYKDTVKTNKYMHRLVAEAFCDNNQNKPEVNHKDENKTNNNADNLEWVTRLENNVYNDRHLKIGKKSRDTMMDNGIYQKLKNKRSKPVLQIDMETGLIIAHESITDATKTNSKFDRANIKRVASGKQKIGHGFYWEFVEDFYKNELPMLKKVE